VEGFSRRAEGALSLKLLAPTGAFLGKSFVGTAAFGRPPGAARLYFAGVLQATKKS